MSDKNWGPLEPLKERNFRLIWSGSLFSNFGHLILGVGAAWEMTRLSSSTEMVALVQTALMLPLMLVTVPGGALADILDRRKVAMSGLGFAAFTAVLLTVMTALGYTTPWVLLALCFLLGGGMALYGPAWQASVVEMVSTERLPAAVGLGSISYNLARTVGPAIGGIIITMAGVVTTFAAAAVFYFPLFLAFGLWKREIPERKLPPERLYRAIVSGARYAIHASAIRNALLRAFLIGFTGCSLLALGPLIARDLLEGSADTYGLLLAATGIGSVFGALAINRLKSRFSVEFILRVCPMIAGAAIIGVGLSRALPLTWLLMLMAGAAYMVVIALINVCVQLAAPRWVTARAVAWYSSSLTGGIALGAFCWGQVAGEYGLTGALMISGSCLGLTALSGLLIPLSDSTLSDFELVELRNEPEVGLELNPRSGPVVIEIDYRVRADITSEFYALMSQIQRIRLRNGGFDWSLSRDIKDPLLWTERFHCPTWSDYIHQRNRFTKADQELQDKANSYHSGSSENRIRRRLEGASGIAATSEVPDSASTINVLPT